MVPLRIWPALGIVFFYKIYLGRGAIRLTKEEQKEGVCGFAATGEYLPKWQKEPYRSRIEKSNIWSYGDKRIREICDVDEVSRPESRDPMYTTFKEYILENYRYTIEEHGFDEACSESKTEVLDDMDEIEPSSTSLDDMEEIEPASTTPRLKLPCCCMTDLSDLRSIRNRILEPFLRPRSRISRKKSTTTPAPDPDLPCCCTYGRETMGRILRTSLRSFKCRMSWRRNC